MKLSKSGDGLKFRVVFPGGYADWTLYSPRGPKVLRSTFVLEHVHTSGEGGSNAAPRHTPRHATPRDLTRARAHVRRSMKGFRTAATASCSKQRTMCGTVDYYTHITRCTS